MAYITQNERHQLLAIYCFLGVHYRRVVVTLRPTAAGGNAECLPAGPTRNRDPKDNANVLRDGGHECELTNAILQYAQAQPPIYRKPTANRGRRAT